MKFTVTPIVGRGFAPPKSEIIEAADEAAALATLRNRVARSSEAARAAKPETHGDLIRSFYRVSA